MGNHTRDFLRNIRPPYFDAFYFVDETTESFTEIQPHQFLKIIFFLEGDVVYTVQDEPYKLIPGDILITPRYTPCSSASPTRQPYRRVVVWFSPELLYSIDPTGQLPAFFEQIDRNKNGTRFHFARSWQDQIFNDAMRLAGELDYTRPFNATISYALISLVLISIHRAVCSANTAGSEDTDADQLVSSVVRYINDNLSKNLSLDAIAEKFFVSKFHLERIFKRQMAVTVHNYIVQRRLTQARQKLYAGESPTKIYKSCGFSSYPTFYRAFQKLYNTTPKQFSEQVSMIMSLNGSHAWDAPFLSQEE